MGGVLEVGNVTNEVQGKVAQLIQMETLEKCTSIAWEAMEEL